MASDTKTRGMIDDITYDVVTVLNEKSKGLAALREYKSDLSGHDDVRQIFDEIRRNDEQAVTKLQTCLKRLLNEERKAA